MYTALTYRVIVWRALMNESERKTGTEFHLFPNNFHDYEYYLERSDSTSETTAPSSDIDMNIPSENLDFSVQYIRTNGYHADTKYPIVTAITTRNELEQYYERYKDQYDLTAKTEVYSDTTIGFLDAIEKYTDDFFKDSYLVIVLLEEGSGSIRHRVDSVADNGDIVISRLLPGMGTADMAEWSIIIEVNSDFRPEQFKVELIDEALSEPPISPQG